MRPAWQPVAVIGLVVIALVALIGVSQWQASHAKELIPWRPSLDAAQIEAKAQHKQVLAYFTASWCGPCQQMKRTTWSSDMVLAAMERHYVAVKIDIDEQTEAAKSYGIEAIPTFMVLSEDGHPTRKASGYRDAKEMADWLDGG